LKNYKSVLFNKYRSRFVICDIPQWYKASTKSNAQSSWTGICEESPWTHYKLRLRTKWQIIDR